MTQSGGTVAIIVAAGSGARARMETPKQYRTVRGRSLVAHCVDAFTQHPAIDQIMLVIGQGQDELARKALVDRPLPIIVTGGATRRESVRNAVMELDRRGNVERVLIHDAARPFLSQIIISRLLDALDGAEGAVPVLPIVDTVARRDQETLGDMVPRESLCRVQTPQAFRFSTIAKAHRQWPDHVEATDDAQMVRAIGREVVLIEGDEALHKLTFPSDFEGHNVPLRVGSGYDVHRFAEGEELWLCGVRLEHERGLSGHSDADVAIHALVDAILGALAMGDIGQHFPPSDATWKGASSDLFLAHAIRLASEAGYSLGNADVTITCESPRIGPHREAMRNRLAEILCVDIGVVSVKATTTEGLGFTGRGEGIAAQAVVSLVRS